MTKIKNINFASSQDWQDTVPNPAGTDKVVVRSKINMTEYGLKTKS